MRIRQVFAAILAALLVVCALDAMPPRNHPEIAKDAGLSVQSEQAPIIESIAFMGLRRIAKEAVAAQIASRVGEPLDRTQLSRDVQRLGRLGWFASVQVEEDEAEREPENGRDESKIVRLTFRLEEHLFLAGVEFSGSRLLSQKQIEKLLSERQIALKTGEPENPSTQYQAASAIRSALADLGHPEAYVQLQREESENDTVRVRFVIDDGPHVPLGRVQFEGEPGVSAKILRRQMERLRPDAWLAGWRGTNVYTPQSFAEDRERLLAYYQNHGYPEARIGSAKILGDKDAPSARFPRLPWRKRKLQPRLNVTIPLEAGRLYRIETVNANQGLKQAVLAAGHKLPTIPTDARAGQFYSGREIETLRRAWQASVQTRPIRGRSDTSAFANVEAIRTFDPASQRVRVQFEESVNPPYIVRKLEFRGIHRFPDRYFRARIPLKEGAPFDDRALEVGLARLARTTYFKPIKKEDIHVTTDDVAHTVDVTIRIEEVGQQRASLTGGRGQFGSTLGIVYTVFNLLHGEELLSSHIEGGPESLQLAMGFAKEGLLGSRATLALSVFNTFLRPRISGSTKGPFFRQVSEGVDATWSYAMTATDSLSVSYNLSRTKTQYSPITATAVTGLTVSDIRTETSSRAAGLGWTRDSGAQRIALTDSVSGGWLGGSENLVRSNAEFGRIWRDRLFDPQNAWAIRMRVSAVGSYSGDAPFYSRLFAGDDLVRGLRPGDLGPEAVISSFSSTGATTYSATPAGASLVGAATVEYRVRLRSNTEAAGFLDVGSGALLPNWLGHNRPLLVNATNHIVHASSGVQLQWTVPGVGVPVRAYYALNVLRLNRRLPMPDGSLFRARNRFAALGWGLGPMF
jgi:outer membrane protein assembly complex protein YaeT